MGSSYTNITNHPVTFRGEPVVEGYETVLQDAGRTADLAFYTVMSYDASEQKWAPLTDVSTVEPTLGIFWDDDIATADLVAGDVLNQSIVVEGHNLILDEYQLVLENSLTLDDVIGTTEKTIRSEFHKLGISFKPSVSASEFENDAV